MKGLTTNKVPMYFWLIPIGLALAIASYLMLNFNMRLIADDFCILATQKTRGIFGNVIWNYFNWSGAYTKFFFLSLLPEYLGVIAYQISSTILFSFLGLAFAWFVHPLLKLLKIKNINYFILLTSLFFVFMLLLFAPAQEIIYWHAVYISYVVPLVFILLHLGFIIRVLIHPRNLPVAYFLIFLGGVVVGGTQEQIAPFQVGFWMVMLVGNGLLIPKENRQLNFSVCIIALISAIIGLLLVVLAPGTAVRQSAVSYGKLPLDYFVVELFIKIFEFWFSWANLTNIFSGILIIGTITYSLYPHETWRELNLHWIYLRPRRFIFTAVFLTFLLSMGSIIPPLYSQIFPERTYTLSISMSIILGISLGFVIGIVLRQNRYQTFVKRWHIVIIIMFVITIASFANNSIISNVNRFTNWQNFAHAWDIRNQQLLLLGEQNAEIVEIPALQYTLNGDIAASDIPYGTSDEEWISACVAQYYGFESIRVSPQIIQYRVLK